jgi:2-haloacid dehalogenase
MHLPAFLTFDCYGTLVDFDLNPTTRGVLAARGDPVDIDAFLATFSAMRFQAVLGPYRSYREVLTRSLAMTMQHFGLEYDEADGAAIVAAVPTFEPFPDVLPVLEQLGRHCRLVIVSNTDDDLIEHAVRHIGVPFDRVITAEQSRAYKPSHAMFQYVLETLRCTPAELVHVAQGFHYDIVPAHDLGWRRVWINRNALPGDPAYGPYHELSGLTGLPAIFGIAASG